MRNEIDELKSREFSLTKDIDSILEEKISLYKNELVKILFFTPYNHSMWSLAIGVSSIINEINLNNKVAWIADRMYFYDSLYDSEGNLMVDPIKMLSMDFKLSIQDFDIIAIWLTNPWSFFDILHFFKINWIPRKNIERSNNYPLLIWWWMWFSNPKPYSRFFDIFTLWQSEKQIVYLINQLYKIKIDDITDWKSYLLSWINKFNWIYSSLDKKYPIDQHIEIDENILLENNEHRYSSQIIFNNTWVIVANNGCRYRCAFCQLWNTKEEWNDIEKIMTMIDKYLNNWVNSIIINSASFTQYKYKKELLSYIREKVDELWIENFQLYIWSVRIDEIDEEYIDQLLNFNSFNHTYLKYTNDENSNFISVAPDFWNERLMKLMKKWMKIIDIIKWIELCNNKWIHNFHLYFMVWVDSETQEDRKDISRLVKRIYDIIKSNNWKLYLKINLYIPTANTIWQRMSMHTTEQYKEYISDIDNELKKILSSEELENIKIITLDEWRLILESFLMRWGSELWNIIEYLYDNNIQINDLNYNRISNIFSLFWLKYDDYLKSIESQRNIPWQEVNQIKNDLDVRFINLLNINEYHTK